MQCKCSLNNNYQIIGLCDIEKFNDKIKEFIDKSWSQIIIPEKLILPSNYPDLEIITKVYLDIKIDSTRIINTPNSHTPNVEGLFLTGKKLLVSGTLCQNIIYVSDTKSQSMHSVNFKVPFNTYIIIDKDSDIDNDKYCIYPCIEDVSVRALDKRTLIKSVTLFLFAHKITSLIPSPPINIANKFIFKSAFNELMSEISFDSINEQLITTSTATIYDPTSFSPPFKEVFRFQLLKSNGIHFKVSASIKNNEDANKFKSILNDQIFEIDDLIFLKFSDNLKVVLTDYPSQGDTYQMIGKSNINNGQGFKITRTGVVPHIILNTIVLNDITNAPVVTIQFDILIQQILCKSTSKLAGTKFIMTLYHSDGTSKKLASTIFENNPGNFFANTFNSFPFQWNDIIKLEYEDNTKVIVTNSQPLPVSEKKLQITQAGLIDV